MKNISLESLEEILNSKLVGIEYDNYGVGSQVYHTVREAVEIPLDDYRFFYNVDKGQAVTIKYRNRDIAQFFVKKKKGSRHYSMFGGAYHDWTISGVRAQYWPEDIVEELKKIDQSIIDSEAKRMNRMKELGGDFAKIKGLFPEMEDWRLFSLLDEIGKARFNDDFKKAAGLD